MGFNQYNVVDNKYYPGKFERSVNKLDPGVYKFDYNWEMEFGWFEKIQFNCDDIIDLPSSEYEQTVSEMTTFLQPETKESFKKYGFLYKRSTLLYGQPGSGKTVLTNKISRDVVNSGGIVIFNPDPYNVTKAFEYLNVIEPNTLTLIVFEELDVLIENQESDLLHILDGEVQKPNTMYVATTNFINRIPKRICRPGRFSSIIQVNFPSETARALYLKHKKVPSKQIQEIVELTRGFSIDELKEVVLATQCLGLKLEFIINRVKATKQLMHDNPEDSLESNYKKNHNAQEKAALFSLSKSVDKMSNQRRRR